MHHGALVMRVTSKTVQWECTSGRGGGVRVQVKPAAKRPVRVGVRSEHGLVRQVGNEHVLEMSERSNLANSGRAVGGRQEGQQVRGKRLTSASPPRSPLQCTDPRTDERARAPSLALSTCTTALAGDDSETRLRS
ncbi:hypothetical protein AAFF_G00201090 [Aldrovandia affinis]|uniref:Uncharacterized protein n=1 Tax=Aldrovandia affinis TaxID=143900 RepID=A0AAD7RKT3_9TELE|nr:hypothetical protein AAFF_G00201090 [Aldrovandia affinis]